MRALARLAIAAVWLYQGGWCKLVAPNERHLRIVAGVPGVFDVLGGRRAAAAEVREGDRPALRR